MMTELIVALNTVIATFSKAKELYEKIDDIELKRYLLEMNEQLLNAKEAALALKEENHLLKQEIKSLREAEDRKLVLKDGAYYDKDNNGPYCPNCYQNKKRQILMCEFQPGYSVVCTECTFVHRIHSTRG